MPLSIALRTSSQPPVWHGALPGDEAPLGERVDGGERVVEHDDACAGDERACEGDALALSAGEIDAALADERVVTVGQLVDERVDAGCRARGEHFVPVRVH